MVKVRLFYFMYFVDKIIVLEKWYLIGSWLSGFEEFVGNWCCYIIDNGDN